MIVLLALLQWMEAAVFRDVMQIFQLIDISTAAAAAAFV